MLRKRFPQHSQKIRQNSANEIISFAYEAKYPESKAEIKRLKELKQYRSEIVSSRENAPNSFTEDTASKIGVVGHSETK